MVRESIREVSSTEGRIYHVIDFDTNSKFVKARILKQLPYDEMLPHNENYS